MTTLRIASSTLESPILFAEHKVFVSAYPAVPKTLHTIGSVVLLHNDGVHLGVSRQLFFFFLFFALEKKTKNLPNVAVRIRHPRVCDFTEEQNGDGGGWRRIHFAMAVAAARRLRLLAKL